MVFWWPARTEPDIYDADHGRSLEMVITRHRVVRRGPGRGDHRKAHGADRSGTGRLKLLRPFSRGVLDAEDLHRFPTDPVWHDVRGSAHHQLLRA